MVMDKGYQDINNLLKDFNTNSQTQKRFPV